MIATKSHHERDFFGHIIGFNDMTADLKAGLLDTVSHEIKTPLTGIRMALLLLQEECSGPLTEKQRTLISYASGDCERLLTTLNSLLDMARSDSGDARLERIPVNIPDYVARVANLFSAASANRNISLKIEGDAEEFPEIYADPERLDEVFKNLIANALKHSPERGVVVLRISRVEDSYLRISMISDGSGFPDGEDMHGSGLALYICREIIKAHGGKIGFDHRSGEATEFHIDLPVG